MTITVHTPASTPGARIREPVDAAEPVVAGAIVDPVAGLAPPTLIRRRPRRRSLSVVLRASGPVVLLAFWWYASHSGLLSEQTFASPGHVWSAFATMAGNGTLWLNLSASLKLAFTGLAIGGSAGIALGVLTGFTRLGDELLDPVLQMIRTVPVLALTPLFIVWFGIDEEPKIILIAVASAFPLYLNVHGAVRHIDPKVVEAARTFGLSRLRLVREIVVPGALPGLLVGLRMSLGISLLALIFAEQINATVGIGYLMTAAQTYFQTDVLVVCIAIYALWGLSADLLVRLLERVLMPWQRAGTKGTPK
jgi:sulfonate transport system permease protein